MIILGCLAVSLMTQAGVNVASNFYTQTQKNKERTVVGLKTKPLEFKAKMLYLS